MGLLNGKIARAKLALQSDCSNKETTHLKFYKI
jgi:hypothetical protein